LGMGDVLTLIEQAEKNVDPAVAAEQASRMMSGEFTLDDFMAQLNQIRKMGSLGGLMKMMPGMSKEMRNAASNVDEGQLTKIEAIIQSMTVKERQNPVIIDGSRRTRIAKGSGSSVNAVNQLLNQFTQMKKMMKQMGGGAMPQVPGMGKLSGAMARAQMARGAEVPAGLEALSAGMQAGQRANPPAGGRNNKKKKGGRVTPPKQR